MEHNRGTGRVFLSYRGNTGGVSFGYNTLPSHFSSPSLYVQNSSFFNNSATAESSFLTLTSQAFFAQIFAGRGGAMGVFINESHHDVIVEILDCVFEQNYARSFAGGLYLLLGGFTTHHKAFLRRTHFDLNAAQLGGGAVQLSFFNIGSEDDPLLAFFDNCTFSNNSAVAGGSIFALTSSTGKTTKKNATLLVQEWSPNNFIIIILHIIFGILYTFAPLLLHIRIKG